MGKFITPEQFKDLKALERSSANVGVAARRAGVSISTMRRIKRSKNYLEFKEQLVKDRGPRYAERRVKSNTTPTKKKVGIFTKLLYFFDIRVQH